MSTFETMTVVYEQLHQAPSPNVNMIQKDSNMVCPTSPVAVNPFADKIWTAPHSPDTVTTCANSSSSSSDFSPRSTMEYEHSPMTQRALKDSLAASSKPYHDETANVGASPQVRTMSGSVGLDQDGGGFYQDATTSRALLLLQQATASAYSLEHGSNGNCNDAAPAQQHQPTITTRKAAQQHYEARQTEKAILQAKLEQQQAEFAKTIMAPKLFVPTPPEKMATTTRQTKAVTPDDVRDPETISGMKYPVQWEREEKAQAKARRLLKFLETEIA